MSSVFVLLLLHQPDVFFEKCTNMIKNEKLRYELSVCASTSPPTRAVCYRCPSLRWLLPRVSARSHPWLLLLLFCLSHFSKHQLVHIPSQLPPGHLVLKKWTTIRCVVQVQIERLLVDSFFFSENSLFQCSFWKVFGGAGNCYSNRELQHEDWWQNYTRGVFWVIKFFELIINPKTVTEAKWAGFGICTVACFWGVEINQ